MFQEYSLYLTLFSNKYQNFPLVIPKIPFFHLRGFGYSQIQNKKQTKLIGTQKSLCEATARAAVLGISSLSLDFETLSSVSQFFHLNQFNIDDYL